MINLNLPDPKKESALLQAIMETVIDGVVTIDSRGMILSVNPAVLTLFGYTSDELIGHNVSLLMPIPDRDKHDEYLASYLETGVANIIGTGREVTALKKNGELLQVDLSVTEVTFDRQQWFTGIIRDMSERNRSNLALEREREFTHSLIETANAIVVLLGVNGEIKLINPFLEELSGYSNSETQGKDWFEIFINEEDRPPLRELFQETLKGGAGA